MPQWGGGRGGGEVRLVPSYSSASPELNKGNHLRLEFTALS